MYDYAKINQNGDKRHYVGMNIRRYSLSTGLSLHIKGRVVSSKIGNESLEP